MNGYGKRSKALGRFDVEIADARKVERRHLADRDLAVAARRMLREERREAAARDELGQQHRPLDTIDKELLAADRVVELDEAGARAEAQRRRVARLQGEQEAFKVVHAAELAAEISPHAVKAARAVRDALDALEAAVEHRSLVAADTHQIVRVLPPPDDRSSYRVSVPGDRVGGILRGAIGKVRGIGVEALVPHEFTAAARDQDGVDVPVVVEEGPPVRSAQERADELAAQREREREAGRQAGHAELVAAVREAGTDEDAS